MKAKNPAKAMTGERVMALSCETGELAERNLD